MREFCIYFSRGQPKGWTDSCRVIEKVSFSIKFKTRVDKFCPPITKRTLSHHVSGIASTENMYTIAVYMIKEDHEPLSLTIDSSRDGQSNIRNPCCR